MYNLCTFYVFLSFLLLFCFIFFFFICWMCFPMGTIQFYGIVYCIVYCHVLSCIVTYPRLFCVQARQLPFVKFSVFLLSFFLLLIFFFFIYIFFISLLLCRCIHCFVSLRWVFVFDNFCRRLLSLDFVGCCTTCLKGMCKYSP